MIETEQAVTVEAPIGGVWDYVRDMERWAEIMPGYREFTIVDENDSLWTLKVGVGGLVRTVRVNVHVDEWAGPERVLFSFALQGDPVKGGGSYTATRLSPSQTAIALKVRVEGTGPMAPMWEAMGGPLLPRFALAFAEQLKGEIEKTVGPAAPAAADAPPQSAAPAPGWSLGRWLRNLWRMLTGGRAGA
jgi:carbon monoxide dehydrogenase subunit G